MKILIKVWFILLIFMCLLLVAVSQQQGSVFGGLFFSGLALYATSRLSD